LIGKGWRQITGATETKGYRYDGIKSEPLKEITAPLNSRNSLSVPVRLRGQVIGNLKLNPADPARRFSEDEIAMVEATAERVALALESSRLLDDAQRRAQREAFLSELSSKLGASYQLDSILRDTVDELGQTLRRATVSFQLVNPTAHGNGNHPSNGTGDSSLE
jgi:GAF domain-containing protein